MSIYSANRLAFGTSGSAKANLSYVGTVGMARAMQESVANEYTMFEAILMNDMRELKGIHEGTILESEFRSLREASVKGFFDSVKKMLRKLQTKIKGVFMTVIANISKYVLVKGKTFVNANRKAILANVGKFNSTATIKNYRKQKNDVSKLSNSFTGLKSLFTVDFLKSKASMDKEAIQNEFLGDSAAGAAKGAKSGSTEDIKKAIMDYCFNEEFNKKLVEFSNSEINDMMARLSEPNSKHIKDLKKIFKDADKSIKDALKNIESAEKEAEKKDGDTSIISGCRTVAQAYQSMINAISSGSIAAVKFGLKQDRAILTKMASGQKQENALLEAMLMEEATDEIDEDIEMPVTDADVENAEEAFEEAED